MARPGSWWFRNGDGVIAAAVLLVVAGLVVSVAVGIGTLHCWWSWSDSGMPTRYRPFAGCQVERHGHWFPASTIRETP